MSEQKTIYRAYKFRLKPTKEQAELLDKTFGCVRLIYNYMLAQRKEHYEKTGKSPNVYEQSRQLPELKRTEEFGFLKEIDSAALVSAVWDLDDAYQRFFKKHGKYPKFKSKHKSKKSYSSFSNTCKIKGDRVYAPKFKKQGIKVIAHRLIVGKTKTMTFSKTPSGKYYVSIFVEELYTPPEPTGEAVGIDLGIKELAVTSDGQRYENAKYLQKYEKKLAKAQKDLARKKGSKKCEEKSNSYIRQKQKVAKLHEKVANSRKNLLHEISREVVDNYDTIALEDLNVQGMKQNRKLAKNISDVSWGMFKEMLKYKAERDNKQVVAINRYYPSSKTCHICGDEKENLSLSEREWTCSNGHVLDRDLNAAINILNQGLLKLESAADVDNTGGVEVNPVSTGV